MDLFIGSHYDVGLQIGRKFKNTINKFLVQEYSLIILNNVTNVHSYYSMICEYCPQYLDEIRGIAVGANIEFMYLFIYMCYECWENHHNGCTDVIVADHATQNRTTIVAHTNDEYQRHQGYVLIYRIKTPDEPELLVVTTAGFIINVAVNAAGLCFTGNYLSSNDQRSEGVPRTMIYRTLIGSYSIDNVIDIVSAMPRASAENYVITTATKKINIECSAKNFTIVEIDDLYAHTNHFTVPEMLKYEKYINAYTSQKRLSRIYSLLNSNYGRLTPKLVAQLIMDHGDGDEQSAICRHTTESTTIFSIIVELETQQIIYSCGHPCERRSINLPFPKLL